MGQYLARGHGIHTNDPKVKMSSCHSKSFLALYPFRCNPGLAMFLSRSISPQLIIVTQSLLAAPGNEPLLAGNVTHKF